MKNPAVDLTNCDTEPIHIPGSIQSHGFLIAFDAADATIRYVSENVKEKTGLEAARVLGKTFERFIEESSITLKSLSLNQLLSYGSDSEEADIINPVLTDVQGVPHYLIVHKSGDSILLAEFEPYQPSPETDLHRMVGISVSRILEGRTVKDILHNTARQIREIIQYDRVMVYQFRDDGHGEVVAEDVAEDMEPFMGLHYPATDIPKQARDLYLINLTRSIIDVASETSALMAMDNSDNGKQPQPLDLTHSVLRAVSPIHIQYLKNMGVAASFSVSLVSNNKLWGLVACHNNSPRLIDYKAREAAKLLGQILSSSLEYRDSEENKDAAHGLQQSADELAKQLQKDSDTTNAFAKNVDLALHTTHARGVAIVFEGNIHTAGIVPSEEEIKNIVAWLQANNNSQVFRSECFSVHYKPALQFTGVASGILACMLSKELGEYIIWCKPEQLKTVNWAGNPEKPAEEEAGGRTVLTPRHSFATWSEQVENTSENWSTAEISAVLRLREDIIYIINQKANQIRQLNERLKEAYDELDSFSFTISHDLKTPLTSIRNYTEIILEEGNTLDEDTVGMLNRIMKSTDKMQVLIREVMSYSRLSRRQLVYEEVNMSALLQEVVTELKVVYKASHAEIVIKNPLNVRADKVMMMQAFTNLISNAIKYSSPVSHPLVTIEAKQQEGGVLYTISDNGIGIDMSYGSQIFEIFKRLDNVAQYEGSGVGLSIVKRIMEKHAAKIWYESELNKGTIFYLLFLNDNNLPI